MTFPKYPEYKDSGVEWLGEVPADWRVRRMKHFANVQASGIDKSSNDGEHQARFLGTDVVYSVKEITEDLDLPLCTASAREWKRLLLMDGDIIITKDSVVPTRIADVSIVAEPLSKVVCGYHLVRCRILGESNPKFFYYAVASREVNDHFLSVARGTTIIGLSAETFSNVPLPFPAHKEQQAIASFLDHETARIDALVAEQQRLIALLKEKRQAVISHAVTKGLDSDVPMKDSGVEWLGEVPAHWAVKPLRHLGECQNGINIGADAFGSGFPFVSYGDVYKNEVLPTKPKGLVQSSRVDRERYSIKKGDVLFTRTSETVEEIGFSSTCFQDIPSATFAGFLIRFRPNEGVLSPSFSRYFFGSQRLRDFFVKEMEIVTRASLGQDLLKRMSVPIAPIEEQVRTAQHLDAITQKIDSLLDQARAAIKLLAERRSALISAAVTGKIDVRGWQPPEGSTASSEAMQTEMV